ncbi:hypothetical protein [Bacteriophage sp.]|nr:hypothetical protein [Caudoviricetes sp.]UOF79992.1 hypothetical protein [Bacteriophage sp.]
MDQNVINILIGICGALGGWWMKAMWEGLKDLQDTDKQLAQQVNNIQILVAGQYMRRDEFEKTSTAIFTKLDRIEDKLDKKVDKE